MIRHRSDQYDNTENPNISLFLSNSDILPWMKLHHNRIGFLKPGDYSMTCHDDVLKTTCRIDFIVPQLTTMFSKQEAKLMVTYTSSSLQTRKEEVTVGPIPVMTTYVSRIESKSVSNRIAFVAPFVSYDYSLAEVINRIRTKKVSVLDSDFSNAWWRFLSSDGNPSYKTYLEGAYLRLKAPESSKCEKTIVYFHANAENVLKETSMSSFLANVTNCTTFAIQYPGYSVLRRGWSFAPQQSEVLAAARASFRMILEKEKLYAKDVIIVGYSMGVAVAIDVASGISEAHRNGLGENVAGVVLAAGFSSIHQAANDRLGPIGKLLTPNIMNSKDKIKRVTAPIRIIHGEKDWTIPARHAHQLYEQAQQNGDVLLEIIPEASHGDEYLAEGVYRAVDHFIKERDSPDEISQ